MTQGDTGSAAPTGRASAISVHRVRFPATLAAARRTISVFDDGAVPPGAGVAGSVAGGVADGDDFAVVVVATEPGPIADVGLRDRCAAWMARDIPDGAAPPVVVTHRGAELTWRPGRAILVCAAEQVELLMPGIVEFTYYDLMLRRLESGVAGAWADLRRDTRLTHAVARADLLDAAAAGRRAEETLDWRITLAQIEPHVEAPDPGLPPLAQKIGEVLRVACDAGDRLATLDGQLEVFEHVYEMTSQRIGEFREAQRSNALEWTIVILLAGEALLLLLDLLRNLKG